MPRFDLTAKQDRSLLRSAEYPSVGEQLDALWKGGVELELMRNKVHDVKIVFSDLGRVEQRKQSLRSEAKSLRNIKEHGGCLLPAPFNVRIDSDPDSQRKIAGLVQKALIKGDDFSVVFRMQDNTTVVLDDQQMIAVGLAVSNHVENCQHQKNAADAAIEASGSLEELNAIDLASFFE